MYIATYQTREKAKQALKDGQIVTHHGGRYMNIWRPTVGIRTRQGVIEYVSDDLLYIDCSSRRFERWGQSDYWYHNREVFLDWVDFEGNKQ